MTEGNQVLILASSSPRRRELLREAGIPVKVHAPQIREERIIGETPAQYTCRLAQEKAQAVAREFPGQYVLGADTIVVVGDQVLEKPRDAEEAARMLHLLSGREHQVTTGVSLIDPDGNIDTRSSTACVYFRKLEDDEIHRYVASGEPLDKAGAYAIQGGAAPWIERVEGEYSNIVGLPLSLVRQMLREKRQE